jgi:hypothetical protein
MAEHIALGRDAVLDAFTRTDEPLAAI